VELLLAIGVICVIWAVVAAILIAVDLHKRGIAVSIIWLRMLILKYLHEYAQVTKKESGRVGPLFYHYVVPLNVALVIVIILAIAAWA
jgi:hypothetical protein